MLCFPIPHFILGICIKYCCEMLFGGLHIPNTISPKIWGANRVKHGELPVNSWKIIDF